MFKTLRELQLKYQAWLVGIRASGLVINQSLPRQWCTFEIPKMTFTDINTIFNRSELQSKYYALREQTPPSEPYTPLLYDINGIASFHKGFAVRHKTRCQIYRDELIGRTKTNLAIQLTQVKEDMVLYQL